MQTTTLMIKEDINTLEIVRKLRAESRLVTEFIYIILQITKSPINITMMARMNSVEFEEIGNLTIKR